jgi:hypothetical protein
MIMSFTIRSLPSRVPANPPFVDGRQVARMAQANAPCVTRMG